MQPRVSAYAPHTQCICTPHPVHMHPTPGAYALHMHRRLFWQYFFCVNFEQAPMKLTQSNAYDRGKIASVPLDNLPTGAGIIKNIFFLHRFWPVLSSLGRRFFFPVLQDSEPENSVGHGERLEKKSLRKKKSQNQNLDFSIFYLIFYFFLLHCSNISPNLFANYSLGLSLVLRIVFT